jgi:hypothetical protein
MPHPADARLFEQPLGDGEGVRDVAVHPHGQRLDPQQEQERVERGEHGAEVAQRLRPQLHQESVDAERLVKLEPVVRARWVRDGGEAPVRPVECAGVDDGTRDRGPVPGDELRGGVDDQVCAELERPAEVRRGERVVHNERRADLVRDRRGEGDVEHVAARIRDRLGEERLRLGSDRAAPAVRVVHVDPVHGDLELAPEVVELRGRAAVERLRDRDPVPRLQQREEEPGLRSEPARERDRADAALEVR